MSQGNDNVKLLVRSQLPEHIAVDNEKFVKFLQAYYDFVKQNYDVRIESLRDVDTISDNIIKYLRRELLRDFPGSIINERKLIKTIRDIYRRKGNVDSIKLLFKLFFNDSIVIRQPGEQILRASDAKWFQYYGITLSQINWEAVSKDLLRAAVRIEPYKTLFETPVSEVNTRKIGDINNSGTITSSDALVVLRFSLNPDSVTQVQRTYINDTFLPFILGIQDPEVLNKYVFSQFNPADIVPNVSTVIIENSFGRFTPIVSQVDIEENKRVRVLFKNYASLQVVRGQEVQLTKEDGTIAFSGKLTPSYSGLEIIEPGKNWQKGQVFSIPGTVKDTVARVKEIDVTGGVSDVEILEYGFSHDDELAFFVSPFPVKPEENASYDITSTPTSVDGTGVPNSFEYILTLRENTQGTTEQLVVDLQNIDYGALSNQILAAAVGIEPALSLFNIVSGGFKLGDINHTGAITSSDALAVLNYSRDPLSVSSTVKNHIETILIPALESIAENVDPNNLPDPDYTGILFDIINPFVQKVSSSTTETTSIRYNFSELTFEEWVQSRALFKFSKSDIFKTKGYYLNDDSLISNTESRLQDNYFYQIFSYLIETTKTGDEIVEILNQFHPAGLKYFFETTKRNFYSIVDLIESFRVLSIDQVYLADLAISDDDAVKDFTKVLPDEIYDADNDILESLAKEIFKPIFDEFLQEEFVAKDFTKVSVDTSTQSESVAKDFTKVSSDTQTQSESVAKDFTKVSTDTQTQTESVAKSFTKKTDDDQFTQSESVAKDFTKKTDDDQFTQSESVAKDFTKVSSDTQTQTESVAKDFTKKTDDDQFTQSESVAKSFTKKTDDDQFTQSESVAKSFTKKTDDDTYTPADAAPVKEFTKVSSDTYAPADAAPVKTFTKVATDTSTQSESTTKNVNKYTDEDSFTVDEGEFLSISAEGYGSEAESYSAELYSQIAYEAYIG